MNENNETNINQSPDPAAVTDSPVTPPSPVANAASSPSQDPDINSDEFKDIRSKTPPSDNFYNVHDIDATKSQVKIQTADTIINGIDLTDDYTMERVMNDFFKVDNNSDREVRPIQDRDIPAPIMTPDGKYSIPGLEQTFNSHSEAQDFISRMRGYLEQDEASHVLFGTAYKDLF